MSTSSNSVSYRDQLAFLQFFNPEDPIFSKIKIEDLSSFAHRFDENPLITLIIDSLNKIGPKYPTRTNLGLIPFIVFHTYQLLMREFPSKHEYQTDFLSNSHDFLLQCQALYSTWDFSSELMDEIQEYRVETIKKLVNLFKELKRKLDPNSDLTELLNLFEHLMNDAFLQNKDQIGFLLTNAKSYIPSDPTPSSISFLIKELNLLFAFQEAFFYGSHGKKSNYQKQVQKAPEAYKKHDTAYRKFLNTVSASLSEAILSEEKGKSLVDRCHHITEASTETRLDHLNPMFDLKVHWTLYPRPAEQITIANAIESSTKDSINYSKKISFKRFFKHMRVLELDPLRQSARTESLEPSPLEELNRQIFELETLILPLLEEYKNHLAMYQQSHEEALQNYSLAKNTTEVKIQLFQMTFVKFKQKTQETLSEIAHQVPSIKRRFLETLQSSSLTTEYAKSLPTEIEKKLESFGLYLYPLVDLLALTGGKFPLENSPEHLFPKKILSLWDLTIIDYTKLKTPSIAEPSKGEDTPLPELLDEGISQPSSSQDLPVISLETSPPQEAEAPQELPAEEASSTPQIKPKKLTWIDVLDEFFGEEIENIRSPEELIALILTHDFVLIRQEGTSHGLYRHTPTGTTVLISYHKDDVKRKTLNNINKSFCQAVLAIRQKELDSILEQEKTAISEQVGGRTKHKRELAAKKAEALRAQAKPLEDDIAALKFKI